MPGMITATTPGMSELVSWFARKKTTLPKKIAQSVTNGEALGEMHVMGLDGVSREVYMAAPETPSYKRTYALLNAVTANKRGEGVAVLYVDPSRTPSVYGSGDVSYAYWLTTEGAGQSFHQYALPRRFEEAWLRDVRNWAPARVLKAVDEELRR